MNGNRLDPAHGLVAVDVVRIVIRWQRPFKLPLQLETSLSQIQGEAPHSGSLVGWQWAWSSCLTRTATSFSQVHSLSQSVSAQQCRRVYRRRLCRTTRKTGQAWWGAQRPRTMTDWDTLHIACLDMSDAKDEPGLVEEGARSLSLILNITHVNLQSATSTVLYQACFWRWV